MLEYQIIAFKIIACHTLAVAGLNLVMLPAHMANYSILSPGAIDRGFMQPDADADFLIMSPRQTPSTHEVLLYFLVQQPTKRV